MKKLILLLTIAAFGFNSQAQDQTKWYNPAQVNMHVVEGLALSNEGRSSLYQRLPDEYEAKTRKELWNLSVNSAGLTIGFNTNATSITIRYKVSEALAFHHMSMTGKSGVDLYRYDNEGDEQWCAAKMNFSSEQITYTYSPLIGNGESFRYELYLPVYNTVEYLEVGVNEGAEFEFEPRSDEPSIIVYGTSITHGACVSRPGMAWPAILHRTLDEPFINLGFSGNGRLETPILEAIKATPAKAVILDCMPNLCYRSVEEIDSLVVNAVKEIRTAHPEIPIIIADHLGYPHSDAIEGYKKPLENSRKGQVSAIEKLKKMGYKNLHFLSSEDIALPPDATVEAIHPSDWGMAAYAKSYGKLLKKVLPKK